MMMIDDSSSSSSSSSSASKEEVKTESKPQSRQITKELMKKYAPLLGLPRAYDDGPLASMVKAVESEIYWKLPAMKLRVIDSICPFGNELFECVYLNKMPDDDLDREKTNRVISLQRLTPDHFSVFQSLEDGHLELFIWPKNWLRPIPITQDLYVAICRENEKCQAFLKPFTDHPDYIFPSEDCIATLSNYIVTLKLTAKQ